MKRIIRKISVGSGHPDQMMHYQVDREHNLSGNKYKILKITQDTELFERGFIAYNIYISNEFGGVLWKTLINVPMVVEYAIDFE